MRARPGLSALDLTTFEKAAKAFNTWLLFRKFSFMLAGLADKNFPHISRKNLHIPLEIGIMLIGLWRSQQEVPVLRFCQSISEFEKMR